MSRKIFALAVIILLSALQALPTLSYRQKSFSARVLSTTTNDLLGDLGIDETNRETTLYALENGGEAFATRLWLFDHARKTIDIQYYSLMRDVTGRIATDRLVRAADRGVKIRLLVDDAANKLMRYDMKLLESHDNIEIRVYNAGLKAGRIDKRLRYVTKNINRLLKRMHSKTLTVDGVASVVGGRNIADMYCDYDRKYNFKDRDLLLLGKAAAGVQTSFNTFWDDKLTVRYSELIGGHGKIKLADPARFDLLHQFPKRACQFLPALKDRVQKFPETFKAAEKSGAVVRTENVRFIGDPPGKNEERKDRLGSITSDSLIALIRQAKKTIDIESPYVILTDSAKQILTDAVNRGVKVRILTNSLASTDNLEAFSAYQRDRETLVGIGVQLYEFKPNSEVRRKLMAPEVQQPLKYKPVYGFHTKSLIIDGHTSVIASYNFDPRSANYNTECLCIVRSAKMAEHLTVLFEEELSPANSWPVVKKCNPDFKAGIKKRIMVKTRRWVPKKLV